MTALPKSMIDNVEVLLEKQIRTVDLNNNIWKLTSDKGEEWFCKNLIITSPLPQTVKLLEELDKKSLLDKAAWND
jgi:predicted NAD/FAD-dependent oxidoreductase